MFLLKMLRHSASDSLDIVVSAESEPTFKEFVGRFFGELQSIIQKVAELRPSEGNPERTNAVLKGLLKFDNDLYRGISLKAMEYDRGLHPKHRITRYHDFFCRNVGPGESVLDIGCGNGFLTSDVAKCTSGRVVGIDINEKNLEFARSHYRADNIEFMLGDVNTGIEGSHFDVVIMSNVLEHLPDRAEFVRRLREKVEPAKFLIRVPMYQREWMVPLKEELGVEYMLDAGHEIEHTQEQLFEELNAAGLRPESWEIRWGEIWCRAVPEVSLPGQCEGGK